MDILTHITSGIAFGTVAAGFSKGSFKDNAILLALGGIGAALPDLDAISLWSKFDSTLGSFFGLEHPGRFIYSATFWYSHHGFLHSLVAGLLWGCLLGLGLYLIKNHFWNLSVNGLFKSVKAKRWWLISFMAGYFLHLLEDLPTPGGSWHGINLLWPSSAYTGGTGQIWWWNNYDLFLIVLGIILLNLLLLLLCKLIKIQAGKLTVLIFLAGFMAITIQISTRHFNFNYTGPVNHYREYEAKSKQIQKEILGEQLFRWMTTLDNTMKINF